MTSTERRRGRAVIEVAGWLTAVNGATHPVLPFYFPWDTHVDELYEPLRWALYATTVFLGVALTLGGVLLVAVARSRDLPPPLARAIIVGAATFWLVGAVYEVVEPFPAPAAAQALPVFSAVVAALLLGGLLRMQHEAG